MARLGAPQGDLTAGDADRRQEDRRLDAVRDGGVIHRGKRAAAIDGDRRAAGAQHLCAHSVQERRQVGDLGLPGGVVDDRAALRDRGGHHDVLGGADAGPRQAHLLALEDIGPGVDVAVAHLDVHTEALQRGEVHVDGARSEVVAARQRNHRLAAASQQRAEHRYRGPHPADQVVGGVGLQPLGHVHVQHVVTTEPRPATEALEQFDHRGDIGDAGHPAQRETALRQRGRRQQLQDAVLGAADLQFAAEGPARSHPDLRRRGGGRLGRARVAVRPVAGVRRGGVPGWIHPLKYARLMPRSSR